MVGDAAMIGKKHGTELDLVRISHTLKIEWRQVPQRKGPGIFEVYRQFSPTRGYGSRFRGRMTSNDWCQPHFDPATAAAGSGQVIFVGLDMGPVEAARQEDARHTVVMAAVFLLVGFAGIVSLFLAQAYRSTRSSLSRVQAFSDNLVENMPIGLLAIDAEGRVVSFNQTAESVFRIPAGDVLGKSARDVLPRSVWALTERIKAHERIVGDEIALPVKGQESIPLDVSATWLQESNGAFMGYLILFRDLTEIKSLKREIERNERLASLGRLAAGVAHEIRNPLSSIKGFATYFRERYKEIPEDQKTAEIMIQEVERLNRVISQLLEFARPMNIQKEPTAIQTLVQHSLRMIQAQAASKNIKIEAKLASDMGEVSLDRDRINQVLLNLYLNAMEAMKEGGTLTIEVCRDDHDTGMRLTVSDTGSGIKKEDLGHVFDPYFTTKPSGTGLGLAIVHNIVEAHGGEVSVESVSGRGTTVSIVLPVVPLYKGQLPAEG